ARITSGARCEAGWVRRETAEGVGVEEGGELGRGALRSMPAVLEPQPPPRLPCEPFGEARDHAFDVRVHERNRRTQGLGERAIRAATDVSQRARWSNRPSYWTTPKT